MISLDFLTDLEYNDKLLSRLVRDMSRQNINQFAFMVSNINFGEIYECSHIIDCINAFMNIFKMHLKLVFHKWEGLEILLKAKIGLLRKSFLLSAIREIFIGFIRIQETSLPAICREMQNIFKKFSERTQKLKTIVTFLKNPTKSIKVMVDDECALRTCWWCFT